MATAAAKESRQLVTLAVVGCGEHGKLSQNLARTRLSHSPRRTNSTVHSCSTIDRTFTASAKTIETPGRRLVDAVIVTAQHNMHRDVVLAFAAQGYRILREKPLATTARDCFDMEVFRRLVPIQLTSDEDQVGGKSLPLPAQTPSTGDEVEKPESDGFHRSGTMRVTPVDLGVHFRTNSPNIAEPIAYSEGRGARPNYKLRRATWRGLRDQCFSSC
ncbi:hypothetical protein F5J12DRAFT_781619 [Pisolithus orientalis]|uniref:uncharacterized protein n=1 Tax=Pisolithus orientalis TaxID=936130 RepID=UPI002225149A|nr:uncharacterized protein F5J12DRAFT_781619 [Pisolithus orientalis]KAI6012752.1 hypothetical protein F5J12DRAFT_781619 [Pisolithus orientalis]